MSRQCANLETKKLYVPELRAEAFKEKIDAGYEGHFWCCRTSAEYGPDDEVVNLRACSDPQRRCFKSLD